MNLFHKFSEFIASHDLAYKIYNQSRFLRYLHKKYLDHIFESNLARVKRHISFQESEAVIEYLGFKMAIDLNQKHDIQFLILKDKNLIYEIEVVQYLRQVIEGDSVFVDIGANNGFYSLFVASLSPKSVIYSFEPVPGTFKRLVRNLEINNFRNAHIFNLALGSKEGDALISISSIEDGLNSLKEIESVESKIPVHMSTLDNILYPRKIDIIKIDVEGYEEEVLKGAKKTINENKNIKIIFEHNRVFSGNSDNGINFLTDLGFNIYSIHYANDKGISLSEISDNRSLPSLCNLLAMRNGEKLSVTESKLNYLRFRR